MKRFWFMLGGVLVLAAALLYSVWGPGPVQWVYALTWQGKPSAPATSSAPSQTPPAYFEGPVSCHRGEPAVASQWAANRDKARAAAERYHFESRVFLWQINQESGFNPTVVSSAGAIGIAQFLPTTAASMQPPVDPWNVDSALDGAARLDLSELRFYWARSLTIARHFHGNRNAYVWGLALAAYNAGGRAVNAALAWADHVGWSNAWTWLSAPGSVTGWSQGQTSGYVRNILGCW